MTKLAALAVLAIAPSLVQAQDWAKKLVEASPRHLEWVQLANGNRKVHAFVAYPERKDKAPVVLIIHEIMGMTDWAQLVADQLAAEGFIAIAPDFLSGMAPDGGRTTGFADTAKIREAMSALPAAQVMSDLDAAYVYGSKLPSGNGKVAVAGFCWGGTQTFRYATHNPNVFGAYVFYGSAPTERDLLARIQAPVIGFYAGNDNRINAGLPDTEKAMKELNKTFLTEIYVGAGHGFMRAGQQPEPTPDNKKARESAWTRWIADLRKRGG